jgi:hypothetical protein
MDIHNLIRTLTRTVFALAALCLAVVFSGTSYASENPFDQLTGKTLQFFTTMEGSVTSVSDGTVTSDLGTESGIRVGMRLNISREGAPFIHPITKEVIGQIESLVGRAEVIEADADSSVLRVLRGSPAKGDILRLTSANILAMFYQSSEVGWNVSEEYYEKLKASGRFELIDTAPGTARDEDIVAEADRLGAEVAIVLTSKRSNEDLILTQRLIWVEDGAELSSDSATIEADLLADIRLGSELFIPKKEHIIALDIPYRASHIASGDINGDGTKDLILSTSTRIGFLKASNPLEQAFGEIELKLARNETILWIDAYDLDGDKKDELIVTAKKHNRVVSRIYKYSNGAFSKELEGNHFLRVLDGELFGQKYVDGEGYGGSVFRVNWGASATEAPEVLDLPAGVNIYDFNFIETPEGERAVVAYDGGGHLNLYDAKGARLWRSAEDFGGAITTFKKKSRGVVDLRTSDDSTVSYSLNEWAVNDKIYARGKSVFVVKRTPISSKAKGLGYKKSQMIALRRVGPSFQEVSMFGDISGNVLNLASIDERIFMLVRPPMGVDTKKLLKGKYPLINKLYIYSLKGR